jgi:hypothetical protein
MVDTKMKPDDDILIPFTSSYLSTFFSSIRYLTSTFELSIINHRL